MRLLFFEIMALASLISTPSSAAHLKTQKSLSLAQTTSETESELVPWDANFALAQTDADQVYVTAEQAAEIRKRKLSKA